MVRRRSPAEQGGIGVTPVRNDGVGPAILQPTESRAVARRKVLKFPVVITAHVFEKVRSIDMTLAEFRELLGTGEVIEEHELDEGLLHELVLIVEWVRPLHVVFTVDERRPEERIVTVYEPDPDQWTPDCRRRRS